MNLELYLGVVFASLAVSTIVGWFIGKLLAPNSIGLIRLLLGFVSFYVLAFLLISAGEELVGFACSISYGAAIAYHRVWIVPLIKACLYLSGLAALCGMTRGPSLPDYYDYRP